MDHQAEYIWNFEVEHLDATFQSRNIPYVHLIRKNVRHDLHSVEGLLVPSPKIPLGKSRNDIDYDNCNKCFEGNRRIHWPKAFPSSRTSS